MVSDCSSKFGCNKHFGEREMVLVCRAISQDHVTKVSCYFIKVSHHPVKSSSCQEW